MKKNLNYHVYLWLVVSLFYAYQYIFRVLPNLLIPELTTLFGIQASDIGSLGIYYLAYGLFHIPIGLCVDRFSAKKVIPICIIACVLGNIPLVLGESWSGTIAGRFLVGAGSSAAPIGLFKVISMYFHDRLFARLLGISVALGLVGAVFGGEPLQRAFIMYGWQNVTNIILAFGVVLAILSYFSLSARHEPNMREDSTVWTDLKMVMSSKYVLLLGVFGGMMLGPLEGFADAWGKEFLIAVYNLDVNMAVRFPSLMFLGMIVGCIFLSYLGSKTQAYYAISIFAAIVMASIFIFVLSGQCDYKLMYLLFTMVGVLSAYQILLVYKATTYMPKRLTGLTSAVTNSIIMGFGFVFHKMIGSIMARFAYVLNDKVVYPNEAFIKALSVIPIGLLMAAVGLIVLKVYDAKLEKKLLTD